MSDTIYALSSAPGRAGVAMIRVSGPSVRDVLVSLGGEVPAPRLAALRDLRDASGNLVDRALVLWMPAPRSFTGEDVAEFHVHGGRAIVMAVLEAIERVVGTRPAEAGEFTRRAVENGKLDLTQAEAVADLVEAQTEAQRRQALGQFTGGLGRLYEDWRGRLVAALAWAEAEIDFSDEDLPGELLDRSRAVIRDIIKEIQVHKNDRRRGEIIREGVHLTVIGPPNAGKSSLINALARRDVAIVHETAGTTRDVIEVTLDIDGVPVIVSDTAGLRDATDAVEKEGVRRALERVASADLILLLLDCSVENPFAGLPADALEAAALTIWNKADLPQRVAPVAGMQLLSLKTGMGWEALMAQLSRLVAEKADSQRDAPVITRARHRRALDEAVSSLERALASRAAELFTEDLRLAARAIGRITGRVDVEELLDLIFRDFCIGK
jgi:tRNA modification GTPase